MTVGAVDVRSDKLEAFSSNGPTDDGRLKPEVSAPDHTQSAADGEGSQLGRYAGTSAATPHLAGFAALFTQLHPDAETQNLWDRVIAQVRKMGSPVPNNAYGHGYIDARGLRLAQGGDEGDDKPESGGDDLMQAVNDIIRRSRD